MTVTDKSIEEFASRLQRQMLAFGRARVPLAEVVDKDRIVVAGAQIFRIPSDWSFHQFLLSYGKGQLGADWVRANLEKGSRAHPVVTYLANGLAGIRAAGRSEGNFAKLTMNGELYAFLSFAYDLFTLADNAKVQQSLLSRVRHADQFQGARYEIYIAASLLRAGFKIEFEDEADSKSTHCEFAATHKKTGRTFSVEAKSRHRKSGDSFNETFGKAGVYRILQEALLKRASHERIVFADVNLPYDSRLPFEEDWHREVGNTLTELERNQRSDDPWPQAIVFFTNRKTSPWPGKQGRQHSTILVTAINHPLFKVNDRARVETEYPDVGNLFYAANNLCEPPSHFFGQ